MKKRAWLGIVVALLVSAGATAWAGDWPQWRGPNQDGIAPDTGINKNWAQRPPQILWQVALGDGGYAGPAVANGKVFIIDHQGDQDLVRALNLANGQEVWRYAYADTNRANYGFARSTPTINEGKVYTLGRLGQLNCLDENTGNRVWARDILKEFGGTRVSWEYSMSPVVDGNKLIVLPGGANLLAALDKNTGQTLWVGGGSGPVGYATPVIATILGVKQYVVFSASDVRGVAAENGQVLWQYPWKTAYDVNAATPLVAENQIFITSGYGTGCAMLQVTEQGATALWQNKAMQGKFSSPVAYGGYLWGGGEGRFVGLDPTNGAVIFQQGGFDQGSVLAVDGVLLVLFGGNGQLTMMTPTNPPQMLGTFTPLGGQSWTAPIMADGKLIIRNTKALACVDMK